MSSDEGSETPVVLGCPVSDVSCFYGTQQSMCLSSPHLKTEADIVSETFCFLVVELSGR
jgi:hypothetical protein